MGTSSSFPQRFLHCRSFPSLCWTFLARGRQFFLVLSVFRDPMHFSHVTFRSRVVWSHTLEPFGCERGQNARPSTACRYAVSLEHSLLKNILSIMCVLSTLVKIQLCTYLWVLHFVQSHTVAFWVGTVSSGLLIFFIYLEVKHCNTLIAQNTFSYHRTFVLPYKFLKVLFFNFYLRPSLVSWINLHRICR